MTILATACAGESTPAAVDAPEPIATLSPPSGPVVEVVPPRSTPPLDPTADPTTPLGELRARYLPVWSPDFDWAFPPEVCGSDWALDAIAEPTSRADLRVLGDLAAVAALSVMRSEYLFSRARAEPSLLAQLCVAVATVGSARSHGLGVLASHLGTGSRSVEPAGHPDEVVVVAAGPLAALAVACFAPGYPRVVTDDGEVLETPLAPARMQAYLLAVSRGLEDAVTDVSYRVSSFAHRPADDCDGLDAWAAEWSLHVQDWIAQGELWVELGQTVTADELCDSPHPDGPDECPRDWSS